MSLIPAKGEDPWDARWPLAGNATILLGLVVSYSLSVGARSFLATFSVLLVAAAASSTVGALLGFIFGVPRRAAEQSANSGPGDLGVVGSADGDLSAIDGDGSGSAGRYVTNTNLAQVSDWLTKVLIGAGLVQLSQLPRALRAASDFIAAPLPGTGATAFAAGLLVYGLTSGFILTFLWTTLTARRYYESVEERIARGRMRIRAELRLLPDVGVEGEPGVGTAEPGRLSPSQARQVGRVAAAVETFTEKYGPQQLPASDYRRLARQLRAAGRYPEALDMYLRAAQADPGDPSALTFAGAIASRFLNDYAQAEQLYARALAINPDYAPAIYNRACNEARKGNVETAIHWLENAIRRDPDRYIRLALQDSGPGGPFADLRETPGFSRLTEREPGRSAGARPG